MCENSLFALAPGDEIEISLQRPEASALSRNGQFRVRTSQAEAEPPQGNCARIMVRDTGPGIPPEVRRNLFDPYFSGRQAGRGLGMGLAKCWRIAQRHGGRLEVQSGAPQGTIFYLSLPIETIVHDRGANDA